MKFLVTVTPRPNQFPPPAVLEKAAAWINARLKDKTFDCCYAFIPGGGFSITNADSAEAMNKLMLDYPGYPFVDFKAEALCDINTAFDQLKAMVQRAAAA